MPFGICTEKINNENKGANREMSAEMKSLGITISFATANDDSIDLECAHELNNITTREDYYLWRFLYFFLLLKMSKKRKVQSEINWLTNET